MTRPSVTLKDPNTKEVEEILAERTHRIGKPKHNLQEFIVKWKEILQEEIRWERVDDLKTSSPQIAKFEEMRRLIGMSTN